MTRAELITLMTNAQHRDVDLGMGGCETFVDGSDIVLSRDTVVELCRIALGEAPIAPTSPPPFRSAIQHAKPRNRMATCGACGSERVIDAYMRRYPRSTQLTARPDRTTDSFYCGCQDDDDGMTPP